nr:hypothetical protein BaRGS_017515 [Batillaria attramentaria]
MVALECELPLSGRLSPPADSECAASFLSVSGSGHVDMVSEPLSSATACESSDLCCEPSEEVEESCSAEFHHHRAPRISPFLNTPKQRKEERRRILKLSIHKMRAVEDPEHFLRRSVLINNTMKRLQRELREEKLRRGSGGSGCYGGLYRRGPTLHYDVLNNSYLLHDEPFGVVSENDRITDDMTDALVTRLETTPVVPTPPPSPAPAPPTSSSSCQQQQQTSLSSVSSTTSSPVISSSSPYLDDAVFAAPPVLRETTSGTCSSESQREKQLYADMDTVFNNLIRALGDS